MIQKYRKAIIIRQKYMSSGKKSVSIYQNPEVSLKVPNELCQLIYTCEFQLDIGNVSEILVSKTIELYSEAINFYLSQGIPSPGLKKRIEYYQDKIKKLLVRKDVQKCLGGHKFNPTTIDLQHELNKVHESAPEQAKALIQFYKAQLINQERMINKTVQEQNQKLQQRIARRSRSKSNYGFSPVKQDKNQGFQTGKYEVNDRKREMNISLILKNKGANIDI